MKKLTMTAIRKMSNTELQNAIDRAEGVRTVWSGASKQELVNKFVMLYNKGMIK